MATWPAGKDKRGDAMQQMLLPAVAALAAGGTAMLVSGNITVAIGAGIGCAIGLWIAQKRQKAPPA